MPSDPSTCRWLFALVFEAWAPSLLQIILHPLWCTHGTSYNTLEWVYTSFNIDLSISMVFIEERFHCTFKHADIDMYAAVKYCGGLHCCEELCLQSTGWSHKDWRKSQAGAKLQLWRLPVHIPYLKEVSTSYRCRTLIQLILFIAVKSPIQ